MEGTKKLGWLEQLKIACLKPREYPRLLQVGAVPEAGARRRCPASRARLMS